MTIEQTVEIPASHVLTLEVPREIPEGKAVIAFTPVPADRKSVKNDVFALCLNRSTFENPPREPLKPLRGIAKGSSFTVAQLLKDRRDEDT
jgi:hypothetical protein